MGVVSQTSGLDANLHRGKNLLELPLELIIRVYTLSSNPLFRFVCRALHTQLNNPYGNLEFCANIWDLTFDWQPIYDAKSQAWGLPDLAQAQTQICRAPWFDIAFAIKIEEECRRRFRGGDVERIPVSTVGAKIPRRILCAPWTREKVQLLQKLTRWKMRAHWTNDRRPYPGLKEAIDDRNIEVLELYEGEYIKCKISGEQALYMIEKDMDGKLLLTFLLSYLKNPGLLKEDFMAIAKALQRKAREYAKNLMTEDADYDWNDAEEVSNKVPLDAVASVDSDEEWGSVYDPLPTSADPWGPSLPIAPDLQLTNNDRHNDVSEPSESKLNGLNPCADVYSPRSGTFNAEICTDTAQVAQADKSLMEEPSFEINEDFSDQEGIQQHSSFDTSVSPSRDTRPDNDPPDTSSEVDEEFGIGDGRGLSSDEDDGFGYDGYDDFYDYGDDYGGGGGGGFEDDDDDESDVHHLSKWHMLLAELRHIFRKADGTYEEDLDEFSIGVPFEDSDP